MRNEIEQHVTREALRNYYIEKYTNRREARALNITNIQRNLFDPTATINQIGRRQRELDRLVDAQKYDSMPVELLVDYAVSRAIANSDLLPKVFKPQN